MGKLRFLSLLLAGFLFCGAGLTDTKNCVYPDPNFEEDPWNSAGSMCADDAAYGTCTYTGQNSYFEQYGFIIPYEAKITGIEVIIEAYKPMCGVSKPGLNTVYVTPDGWITNGSKTTTFNYATPTVITLGSSGDLWGANWSPHSFNSGLFRTGILCSLAGTWLCAEGESAEWDVDYVTARVSYLLPNDPIMHNQLGQGGFRK
jgi:hypothetical protein